jgi:hypothetical protein
MMIRLEKGAHHLAEGARGGGTERERKREAEGDRPLAPVGRRKKTRVLLTSGGVIPFQRGRTAVVGGG